MPPPVAGQWPYGDDIHLVAMEIAPTTNQDGTIAVPGSVKIGARVRGEAPVWILFSKAPEICTKAPEVCMQAQLNGFAVSPHDDELRFLV